MGKISLGANVEGNFVGRIVNGGNNPGGSIREASYKLSNVLQAPCINIGINLFAVRAETSCVV